MALNPMEMVTADMVPDNPGTWLFHCHIAFHNSAGMAVRYQVAAGTTVAQPYPPDPLPPPHPCPLSTSGEGNRWGRGNAPLGSCFNSFSNLCDDARKLCESHYSRIA
jgi:hypothetical protein